jgi:hypothetical protein
MPDGNGGQAFTHSGTAPSHDHPQMRAHVQQIVGKAHTYLMRIPAIAITRFGASRSERSDVSLGVWFGRCGSSGGSGTG